MWYVLCNDNILGSPYNTVYCNLSIITWVPYYNMSAVIARSDIVRYYIKKLQELRQNINQMLVSQKTPHSSPLWVSYSVSFVNIF